MIIALAVGIAGSVGSIARYLVDGAVQDRSSGAFPFGTVTVNLIGSFVLGVLTGLLRYHALPASADTILGTGFCGGLTTWSTASWETVRLAEQHMAGKAAANALGGLVVSMAAAAIGIGITVAL